MALERCQLERRPPGPAVRPRVASWRPRHALTQRVDIDSVGVVDIQQKRLHHFIVAVHRRQMQGSDVLDPRQEILVPSNSSMVPREFVVERCVEIHSPISSENANRFDVPERGRPVQWCSPHEVVELVDAERGGEMVGDDVDDTLQRASRVGGNRNVQWRFPFPVARCEQAGKDGLDGDLGILLRRTRS